MCRTQGHALYLRNNGPDDDGTAKNAGPASFREEEATANAINRSIKSDEMSSEY